MILKERYDTFSQRLAAFYCTALAPMQGGFTIPGITETAFSQLHQFFYEFYKLLYEQSETILMNRIEDMALKQKEHKSKNKTFKKSEDATKLLITDFIDFLYNAGQAGSMNDCNFLVDKEVYEKYISRRKREKVMFLDGLAPLGLHISITEDYVILMNNKYPDMFRALSVFSRRCAENIHKQGRFCFFTCDLNAMDIQYEPKAEDFINRIILCNNQYSYLLNLHHYMNRNGYAVSFKLEADVALEILYTNRKIKSSPLLGILLDVRYEEPVIVNMKFVSTSRLAPIVGTLSDEMQEAFYRDTGHCRGADCGWCKNQKGLLRPSLLSVKDKQKTICWYAQKSFTKVKDEELDTILKYIEFHEQLVV